MPLSPLKLNKFVCTKCNNKWFSNGKALQEHNDDVHKIMKKKVFQFKSKRYHIVMLKKSIHEGHKYKCEEKGCKKECSVRSGLIKHIRITKSTFE